MPTIDIIVKKLQSNPTQNEKAILMTEFQAELQKFEPIGEFHKFQNTAIYYCFMRSYEFYKKN